MNASARLLAVLVLSFLLGTPALADQTAMDNGAVLITVAGGTGPASVDTGSSQTTLPSGVLVAMAVNGDAQLIAITDSQLADGTTRSTPVYRIAYVTIEKCRVQGPFYVLSGPFALLGNDVLDRLEAWHKDTAASKLYFTCPKGSPK